MTTATTATVYEVRVSRRDRVRLLLAKCDNCTRDVMHGGGRTAEDLVLGTRLAHCSCAGAYDLILPLGVEVPS